jgi:protein-S-isoprenylcysteine O-methyltransferase Ste14
MLKLIFERQWLHAIGLAALAWGVCYATRLSGVTAGSMWGVASQTWLELSCATAVLHQVLVWFCWRTELHAKFMSRTFGANGFKLYAFLFSVIGIARVVFVFILAFANAGTFTFAPVLMKVLAVIMLLPALYLFYSVRRYFGFERAFGIDHFDESYRTAPIIKQGIFKYTNNGMYVFGFFILWVPGLWLGSQAALVVALFNHLYIWVHFYATEQPDMKRIYRP